MVEETCNSLTQEQFNVIMTFIERNSTVSYLMPTNRVVAGLEQKKVIIRREKPRTLIGHKTGIKSGLVGYSLHKAAWKHFLKE